MDMRPTKLPCLVQGERRMAKRRREKEGKEIENVGGKRKRGELGKRDFDKFKNHYLFHSNYFLFYFNHDLI